MIRKKGISMVVTTVLLILISIIAVIMVASFIIPMIKEKLKTGTSCFDLRDYSKIVESDYTCFNSTHTLVMIERGADNYTINGFYINILSGVESKSYRLISGLVPGAKMLTNSGLIENIILPGLGESRTYIFDMGDSSRVSLGIIDSSDKICEVDSYLIERCS